MKWLCSQPGDPDFSDLTLSAYKTLKNHIFFSLLNIKTSPKNWFEPQTTSVEIERRKEPNSSKNQPNQQTSGMNISENR